MSSTNLSQLRNLILPNAADDESGTGEIDIKPESSGAEALPEESREQENERRLLEQKGHRQISKVNARVRHGESVGNELDQVERISKHPYLDSPRFDGIAPDQNPDVNINPDARWIYENERAEQEKKKELRLSNDPKYQNQNRLTSTPSPKPQ